MSSRKGTLYLIPSSLGECIIETIVPSNNTLIINTINHFIVENIRTARRQLIQYKIKNKIDDLTFYTLNNYTNDEEIEQYLQPAEAGLNIGLLSEAGCPAIADPGAKIVMLAHKKNISVKPLVGPSSILLALIASGLNGQRFSFYGYLPIEKNARIKTIKRLEQNSAINNETQIFIETPYRNISLYNDLLTTCNNATLLCIAANLTTNDEYIKTKSIAEWKTDKPLINKIPALFLLLKP